jgi:enoyl-CoA hydratase
MNAQADVLFEEKKGRHGDLGMIVLNRPAALNALNLNMVQAMYARLQIWAQQDSIKAVIIQAAPGRAFCAGGDLRRISADFFYHEYHLNHAIFHFPKPYIALLNGITMGGGVGISIHGSHRVVTEHTVFAMPETGIGFFPDVGGTYFLPRLADHIGFYLGLSGVRLASDDCAAIGVATQKIAAESLANLVEALAQQPFEGDVQQAVTHIINQFTIPVQTAPLLEQRDRINHCFAGETMEAVMQTLQAAAHPFYQQAAAALAKKSPTSLKVTLRALQTGQQLDFDACMQQEYRLACRFLQQHDFSEGIRAAIIDKDQTPFWEPPTLQAVSASLIDQYFKPLAKELY